MKEERKIRKKKVKMVCYFSFLIDKKIGLKCPSAVKILDVNINTCMLYHDRRRMNGSKVDFFTLFYFLKTM
jgi:hypothetical protein